LTTRTRAPCVAGWRQTSAYVYVYVYLTSSRMSPHVFHMADHTAGAT
jgi:hypothetical protein